MGQVFVGTSGFSFDDWIGEVYPAHIKKYEMLPYYEKVLGFNALEINYTYYAMPSGRTMESFVRRTSQDFFFVVKAYKGITHEKGTDFHGLCARFKEGIGYLGENMKAVLFQFPFSYRPDQGNLDYLEKLTDEFRNYNPVVEFRNKDWLDDRYTEILKKLSLGNCIVDEPKLKGLLPFYPVLTSGTGYFRFHGRNEDWFNAPAQVRYDYLYTDEELKGFVPSVEDVARGAENTFVFFNNCHAGKAVKNALMLMRMMEAGKER